MAKTVCRAQRSILSLIHIFFTTISENIGSANIDLGSETVIKDIVTPYFTVPQHAGAIRLSTAAYNGSAFGAPVAADPSVTAAIDPATRAVNVTGFDFHQNYVSTNAKADGTFGKKLIIEFDVSVDVYKRQVLGAA